MFTKISLVAARYGLMRHLLAMAMISRPRIFIGSFMATSSVPGSSGSKPKGITTWLRSRSAFTSWRTSMGICCSYRRMVGRLDTAASASSRWSSDTVPNSATSSRMLRPFSKCSLCIWSATSRLKRLRSTKKFSNFSPMGFPFLPAAGATAPGRGIGLAPCSLRFSKKGRNPRLCILRRV